MGPQSRNSFSQTGLKRILRYRAAAAASIIQTRNAINAPAYRASKAVAGSAKVKR